MEKETWKPLTYHGEYFGDVYEISNTGKLRNKISMKERKLNLNKQGYLHCIISQGRKRKIAIKVHRAVAENFVSGNADNLVINHKDGNKTNNNAKNLEFVTVYENNHHAIDNGLVNYQVGCQCHKAKLKEEDIKNIRRMFSNENITQKQIAEMYEMDASTISLIVNRKTFKNIN